MHHNFQIKGFIQNSFLDWPGKICSVIFMPGCNFRCPFCHNSRLVLSPETLPDYPLSDILKFLHTRKKWIDGVTITGGEPTTNRNLPELIRLLKTIGVAIKLDTNGTNPKMLEGLLGDRLLDLVAMDIKAPMTREEYSRVAGIHVNMHNIKKSVQLLKDSQVETIFRTTIVPGLVEEPQLAAIRKYLGNVSRYKIQSFRNASTLDPNFQTRFEFPIVRLENMQLEYEIPQPESNLEPESVSVGINF
jgi:pyruvate formate lyase activating enzyme